MKKKYVEPKMLMIPLLPYTPLLAGSGNVNLNDVNAADDLQLSKHAIWNPGGYDNSND